MLKNRRMDASSVRFQVRFARTRRPSHVFQQTVSPVVLFDLVVISLASQTLVIGHAGSHRIQRNSNRTNAVDKPFGTRHFAGNEDHSRVNSLAELASAWANSLFGGEESAMKTAIVIVALLLVCGAGYWAVCHFQNRPRSRQVPDADLVFGSTLSEAADAFLTASNVEFNLKQARFHEKWLANYERYDIDTHEGRLILTCGDSQIVFDAQSLGSVCKSNSTWQWAWHNPNVPEHISRASAELKPVGAKYGLPYLQDGIIPVPNERFPPFLGGIAMKVTQMEGLFVANSEDMDYYFLLANPRREPVVN